MPERILFVDDEESLCFAYENHLKNAGYEVATSGDYHTVMGLVSSFEPDLIIADIVLGGRTGIDLLREIRNQGLTIPVIMVTGEPNVSSASQAVKLGAYDYVCKPFRKEKMLTLIDNALREKRATEEKERYRQNLEALFSSIPDGIVTVDDTLTITDCNTSFEEIFDLEKEEWQNADFKELIASSCPACLEAIQQTLIKGIPVLDMQAEYQTEAGSTEFFLLNTALLRRQGRPSGVILIVHDMTHLNDLEKQLTRQHSFHDIIGKSEKMQRMYNLLESLADTDATVLITGESGTGKELVARALHYQSNRKEGPLITVDCSTLTESILESELFGHTKGAFTGAIQDKVGRIQLANGGTIFLDEIGNISSNIQQKLLRFLQEKEIERVGDSRPLKVDVRIIAATNANLKEMVEQGSFREDLYYRLKVMPILLPPLRERREDIPLLIDHFIEKFNRRMNRAVTGISNEVLTLFMKYPWPGNIRELEHAMEHAFILCRSGVITADFLPEDLITAPRSPSQEIEPLPADDDEKERLLAALRESGWNKAKAARKLGLSRRTIYRQMIRYDIATPDEM